MKTPFDKINFLFNGQVASEEDYNKNFTQLSNSQNKADNSMNFIIQDVDENEDEDEEQMKIKIKKKEENKDKDKDKDKDSDQNKDKNKNKDKNEKKEQDPKPFAQYIKLLNKTYLIAIAQLALIEILLYFGLYFELDKIFTINLGAILGTLIPISFSCGFFSIFFMIYLGEIRKYNHKFNIIVYFSLVVYIPYMVLYSFLLSKLYEPKYILSLLTLLLLNYVYVEFIYIVFKIKKKYAYAAFASIINLIYLVIFFVIFKETSAKVIARMISMSFLFIVYIQLVNYFLLYYIYQDSPFLSWNSQELF